MAIAGPLASTILGIGFLGIARLACWPPGGEPKTPVVAVLLWLGYINLMLAIFNMIHGYPLDGGRVLRVVISRITHDAERVTRLAAQGGQGVAFVFILLGPIQPLEIMSRNDVNQLPVVSNGRIEGVLSRSHILRYLQTHAEVRRR
jgi:Zn-dependent protease